MSKHGAFSISSIGSRRARQFSSRGGRTSLSLPPANRTIAGTRTLPMMSEFHANAGYRARRQRRKTDIRKDDQLPVPQIAARAPRTG